MALYKHWHTSLFNYDCNIKNAKPSQILKNISKTESGGNSFITA